MESLSGRRLDSSRWDWDAGAGEIVLDGDAVRMRSSGSTFPYVFTRIDPFPSEGDFRLTVRFHYVWVRDCGVGIILSSYRPPVGLPQDEVAALQEQAEANGVQIGVWQDSDNGLQLWYRSRTERKDVQLPSPNTAWNELTVELTGGRYVLYLNGVLQYTSQPTPHRPQHIWMGHPANLGSDCRWDTLEVDFVRVEQLP